MQQIEFRAMGCQMLAAIDSDNPHLTSRLAEVPAWFEAWEQRFSRFREHSELNQLNQRSGQLQPVSSLMSDVLRAALRAQRTSAGLVSPLLLAALEEAGYDRSFEQMHASTHSLEQPLAHPASDVQPTMPERPLHLDSSRRMLFLPPGARLDLGGIVKGWAADRAAQRLGRHAPALVDAGGDIAVSAPQAGGDPWPVGVADPHNPANQLDLLLISRGGVATSGRDVRHWQRGRTLLHHIIDPRTARPALTDLLSVTVAAPSAQAAEAAAKTVFILGSVEGFAWLNARPSLAGLLVLEDGEPLYSRNWLAHIWR